jgi:hypothetical protein
MPAAKKYPVRRPAEPDSTRKQSPGLLLSRAGLPLLSRLARGICANKLDPKLIDQILDSTNGNHALDRRLTPGQSARPRKAYERDRA